MDERFELLDELKKEFESVSSPLSKIDELPDFVEGRIWVEIQRLLEENAHLKKRLDPVTSNYSRQTGIFPEGYSQEAISLAERLAVASGDTEDYWGDWYNKALATLSRKCN